MQDQSTNLAKWLARLDAGWKPNRRLRRMGWEGHVEFFGVTEADYWQHVRPRLHQRARAFGQLNALLIRLRDVTPVPPTP